MTIKGEGRAMTADRKGLGFVGFIFAGVTAAVMLTATTVVVGHVEGRLAFEPSAMVASLDTAQPETH